MYLLLVYTYGVRPVVYFTPSNFSRLGRGRFSSSLTPNHHPIMPGRPPRKPVGKVAASTPGSVDRSSMKAMPIKKKLARLAVQQAGQNKVSKGMHLLSADTAYKRLGNGKLGGMSKKKQRQYATRAKNIATAHAASAAVDEDRMAD